MASNAYSLSKEYTMKALTAVAVFLAVSNQAFGEDLRTTERRVQVKYSDGAVENYAAVYTGVVNFSVHEDGGPSTITHPIDDRRCNWSVQNFVKREIYQVNRAGRRSIYEPLTAVFATSFANEGTSFSILTFRPGNCNDTQNRRDSDINNARNKVTNEFQNIVNNDIERLADVMRNELDATQVVLR